MNSPILFIHTCMHTHGLGLTHERYFCITTKESDVTKGGKRKLHILLNINAIHILYILTFPDAHFLLFIYLHVITLDFWLHSYLLNSVPNTVKIVIAYYLIFRVLWNRTAAVKRYYHGSTIIWHTNTILAKSFRFQYLKHKKTTKLYALIFLKNWM